MTLAPDMQTATAGWLADVERASPSVSAGPSVPPAEGDADGGAWCRPDRYGVLLEDSVFAEWATEAGARYDVSELEALGALAEALARDGMARGTASTKSRDLLVHA